ncbi:hypothetical protein Xcel_2001 [Xylanimonas cellulosilytica DSM 15894]|uniref:Uncharacterized protein n=2 Tax=Xylanimonas TaxID=186188 RepID=D1BTP1_XYLCX|nr:hypothetical protein Xcel_2001 [Xylanimonas cellulosilytica DSM 15894]
MGREDDAQGDGIPGPADGAERLPDDDVEARWADIVAQLGELDATAPAGDGTPPADPPAPARPATGSPAQTGHVVARAPGPRDWPATPDVEALEDAESHFTPPDPGPVVTGRDPLSTLAWSCAVGIPLLAVVALIVRSIVPGLHVPGWTGPLAAVAFLAAVAVLVWRMPQRRDPDDHDDGAVV